MKKKKLLGLTLAVGTAVAAAVISGRNKKNYIIMRPAKEINNLNPDDIIDEFLKLTEIPRKTYHEDKISDYLCRWAGDNGLICIKDKVGNVIIDKPASHGYENKKRVILQAHTDMVCVSDSETQYDPLVDSINTVMDTENGLLRAKGTSLGADDGIGVAEILYILKRRDISHPPLRAIFTVSEECGMDGALSLDASYLDAGYLINIDNEDIDSLCNSCADSSTHILTSNYTPCEPSGDTTFKISIFGLNGGHSGTDINLGRANAVQLLGSLLKDLSERLPIEIAEIVGGEVGNAIPKSAEAVFVTDQDKAPLVKSFLEREHDRLCEAYHTTEPGLDLCWKQQDEVPTPVVSKTISNRLLSLISILPCGVGSMSPLCDGLVESSSNIGVLAQADNMLSLTVTTRSSVKAHSERLDRAVRTAAALTGFDYDKAAHSPGWALNPDSVLVSEYKKAFKEVNGREITVSPIHAGLECGCFARKNPELDMISVGPTITNVHSPGETLHIKTVAENTAAIIAVLKTL